MVSIHNVPQLALASEIFNVQFLSTWQIGEMKLAGRPFEQQHVWFCER